MFNCMCIYLLSVCVWVHAAICLYLLSHLEAHTFMNYLCVMFKRQYDILIALLFYYHFNDG